jgi:hypothetical protein
MAVGSTCAREKRRRKILIAEKAGELRGLRTLGARDATAGIVARWQTASGDGMLPRCVTREQGRLPHRPATATVSAVNSFQYFSN